MNSSSSTQPPPLVIDHFRGPYRDFSNFPLRPVIYQGMAYPSKEHAFAAAKTLDPAERLRIAEAATSAAAKTLGRSVTLRPDWDEQVRYEAMQQILDNDFGAWRNPPTQHDLLLSTGDALLIEGTTWHDEHWGRCSCAKHAANPGLNHLGRELMALRARLRGDVDRWPRVAITGHRVMDSAEADWVTEELPRVLAKLAAEHGTATIIDGMAVGADTIAARAALAAGMSLWSYVPYPQQADKFSPEDKASWLELRAAAEREVVLSPVPAVRHLHDRNRLMMLDSNVMIAIYDPNRTTGGAVTTAARAHADGWPIIKMDLSIRRVSLLAGEPRPWS